MLLSITNLSNTVGKKSILHSITLSANSSSVVALLGPNGAGKTTLLKTIMGFYPAPSIITNDANRIEFDDALINTWPVHQRVMQGLLYLPQNSSLFTQLSVHDNLLMVYQHHPYWKNRPYKDFETEMHHWLSITQLVPTLPQKADTLSGGQKRKLEVVRALLMKPRMLMLDEPFAGVDPKSIYELKKIFTDLVTQNIGILISDHHVDQLLSIATTAYVIVQGRVVCTGGIKDILENSYTKESYLGTQFYEEISQKFL